MLMLQRLILLSRIRQMHLCSIAICMFIVVPSLFSQTRLNVSTYLSNFFNPPAISPLKSVVSASKNAICLVRIYHTSIGGIKSTTPSYQTGVLISSDLVLTSMHGFAPGPYNWATDANFNLTMLPVTSVADVSVYFGWLSGAVPAINDPGWISIKSFDPTPTVNLQINLSPAFDYIVLELNASLSAFSVAPLLYPFPKGQVPTRPFLLHHSINPDIISPMQISYDNTRENPVEIFGNGIAVSSFFESDLGGSGGGLFWSDNNNTSLNNNKLFAIQSKINNADRVLKEVCTVPVLFMDPTGINGHGSALVQRKMSVYPRLILTTEEKNKWFNSIMKFFGRGSSAGYDVGEDDLSNISYKWLQAHLATGAKWFAYGSSYELQSITFPLSSILMNGYPPAGKYKLHMSIMGSIAACNEGTNNTFTGTAKLGIFGCENINAGISLADYSSAIIISVYLKKYSGWAKLRDITNMDLIMAKSYVGNCDATTNYKNAYSDIVDFVIQDDWLQFDQAELNANPEIKLEAKLRYTAYGGAEIVQGISIHNLALEYIDPDPTNPWYTKNNTPSNLVIPNTSDLLWHEEFEVQGRAATRIPKPQPMTGYYTLIDWGDGIIEDVTTRTGTNIDHIPLKGSPFNNNYQIKLNYKKDNNNFYSTWPWLLKVVTAFGKPGISTTIDYFSSSVTQGTYPLTVSFWADSKLDPVTGFYPATTKYEFDFADGTKDIYTYEFIKESSVNKLYLNKPDGTKTQCPYPNIPSDIGYGANKITHTFQRPGTYNVKVTVWGTAGTTPMSSNVLPIVVKYASGIPLVGISAVLLHDANTTGSFQFSADESPTITNKRQPPQSYLWDFGDGTTSTEKNPIHVFQKANEIGDYNVKFRATNESGSCEKSTLLLIGALAPCAFFVTTKETGVAPFSTQFVGSTNCGIVSNWQWDFGDGTTSSEQSPVHIFKKSGKFSVKLTTIGWGSNIPTSTYEKVITVKANIAPILNLLLGD